jgi:predicted Zn-dependent protease
MTKLEPKVTQQLQSAYGFINSGNRAAAEAELARIPQEFQEHPAILTARMSLCQSRKQWDAAAALAEKLIAAEPQQPVYWLQRALFLHEQGRVQEAWDKLLPAAEKFPKFWMIPYSLACYTCRLGKLEDAWNQLGAALKLVEAQSLKTKALAEPDLQPLWPRIAAI